MFLTYRYGKMLQFPMGLASAYSWVLNLNGEQSPEPFGRSGTSLEWRAHEVQPCLGQGATLTAAAAAPGNRQSFTLCSVPSNLREDPSLKCPQKKYFGLFCT